VKQDSEWIYNVILEEHVVYGCLRQLPESCCLALIGRTNGEHEAMTNEDSFGSGWQS
jgi:hypothetical protein